MNFPHHMIQRVFLILAAASFAALFGCASSSQSGSPTTTPSPAEVTPTAPGTSASAQQPKHGECLVCKKNADLACVDVDVDKNTPSVMYKGQTYYFCSDECKHEFEKNPEKYAKK